MNFEQRLAALERSNRRHRLAWLSLAVVTASAAAMGADDADERADMLTAQRFVLVDDEGNQLGYLGSNGGAAVLTLEPKGLGSAISLRADRAGAYVIATRGKQVAAINVENAESSLRLTDGTPRLKLHVFAGAKEIGVRMLDDDGVPRALLGIDGPLGAKFGILNPQGKTIWRAPP